MNWFPLCNYTHYSLLRGFSKPEELVRKCLDNGYEYCGIADYKTLSGAVSFYKECTDNGIKPIIGCSFDTFKLFAKNKDGWYDLIQLVSSLDADGNYDKSFLDHICCRGNLLAVVNKDTQLRMNNDDVYQHCSDTASSYFSYKEQARLQQILICSSHKTSFSKVKGHKNYPKFKQFFERNDLYLKNRDEVNQGSALLKDISLKCDQYNILHKPILPHFEVPAGHDEESYLKSICNKGWSRLLEGSSKITSDIDRDKYRQRYEHELSVIKEANLFGYFLIVHDIIDYVVRNGWLYGPGRGSAAGCLISYLMGITQIDPLEFDLLFERFYNSGRNTADRVSLPDIDIDIPSERRDQIISYIKDKYGHDKVSQMLTFTRLQGKSALKEVLRINNACGFSEMNEITKHIPDKAAISDQLEEMDKEDRSIIRWTLLNNDKIKDFCSIDDDGNLHGDYAEYFKQAIEIEKTFKAQSVHAAGVVISAQPLSTICPMVNHGDDKIAALEMDDLEAIGNTKFDVLAVRVLDKHMRIRKLNNL